MRRAAAFLVALSAVGCAGARPSAPRADSGALRLAVVGDVESLAQASDADGERNDAERAIIVRGIADERPDLVAITGDCAFDRGSDARGPALDPALAPVRAERIAAIGPQLREHEPWYSVALGPLRLIVVDSDEDRLEEYEQVGQRIWFERTLRTLDDDPAVRGVFVVTHHPPFTNSALTDDATNVQMHFVPAFLRARKTLAMLTGHVHSYERFARDGKMFVVSGGGGAPRAPLLEGLARRHPDDLVSGPPLRDFEFVVFTLTDAGIHAEARGVAKGGHKLRVIDRFDLPWPR